MEGAYAGGFCDWRLEAADLHTEALQPHLGGDISGAVQQWLAGVRRADLTSSPCQQLAGERCAGQSEHTPLLMLKGVAAHSLLLINKMCPSHMRLSDRC